ncbi:MAG TPA: hypothetical protein VG982_02470 [Candidatus Paceibacterota bacterium]|nr:hypothetical protein [Candidatus Paceibacterota bacterium]
MNEIFRRASLVLLENYFSQKDAKVWHRKNVPTVKCCENKFDLDRNYVSKFDRRGIRTLLFIWGIKLGLIDIDFKQVLEDSIKNPYEAILQFKDHMFNDGVPTHIIEYVMGDGEDDEDFVYIYCLTDQQTNLFETEIAKTLRPPAEK